MRIVDDALKCIRPIVMLGCGMADEPIAGLS